MNKEELIASGQLELYVMGALPEQEAAEVDAAISKHPEIKEEIEQIESSLIDLGAAVAPNLPSRVWGYIINSIRPVTQLDTTKSKVNWSGRLGWAAAILCMGGILWMLKQNNDLQETIQYTTTQNTILKEQNTIAQEELSSANSLLSILRSKDYNTVLLPGNATVAPDAYAKIYFNPTEQVAYVDTNGLPSAPKDKVYQVWSLIMEPLTPRSMGLIDSVAEIEPGIYRFENVPAPEAFGITLEPAGGSQGPTLAQLYTLGTVGQ